MGVYSNLALEKINEQSAIENCEPNSLLEFAVDIQRADHAMFNSLLEADFHEAYVNNGVVLLTEADEKESMKVKIKNIFQKIVEFLKNLITKIKNAVESFIVKVEQFFAKNKVQGKVITAENIKEKFKDAMDTKIKWVEDLKDNEDWTYDILNARTSIDKSTSEEDIAKIFKDAYEKVEKHFEELHKEGTITEFLADNNISIDKISKNILQGKFEQLFKLKEDIKKCDQDTKAMQNEFDPDKNSDIDDYYAARCWMIANTYGAYTTKVIKLKSDYIKDKLKADRALFTKFSLKEKAVKPAAEDKKEEVKKESCVYYNTKEELLEATEAQFFAIDMLNENYAISIFGD